jgi:hypothetical protein
MATITTPTPGKKFAKSWKYTPKTDNKSGNRLHPFHIPDVTQRLSKTNCAKPKAYELIKQLNRLVI